MPKKASRRLILVIPSLRHLPWLLLAYNGPFAGIIGWQMGVVALIGIYALFLGAFFLEEVGILHELAHSWHCYCGRQN